MAGRDPIAADPPRAPPPVPAQHSSASPILCPSVSSANDPVVSFYCHDCWSLAPSALPRSCHSLISLACSLRCPPRSFPFPLFRVLPPSSLSLSTSTVPPH